MNIVKLGFLSINILCASNMLQLGECRVRIPREIFFKIANDIVPNLLCPMHPKEIRYQDEQLKFYRLVSKTWRDLLDQRIGFEQAMKFFVIDNGHNYEKCALSLYFRWNQLAKLYSDQDKWFNSQKPMPQMKRPRFDENAKISNDSEKPWQDYPVRSNQYFKIMKRKLKKYDFDGFLMLQNYVNNEGFLNTYDLIGSIYLFIQKFNKQETQEYKFLKELMPRCDLTDLFSRLFEDFIRNGNGYCLAVLQQKTIINYRRFLDRMHASFCNRVKSYTGHITFLSQSTTLPIQHFFEHYKESFMKKDNQGKYFLYHLLLHSKDDFFIIQMQLLIGYIKGIEQSFNDYPADEQFLYRKLFEANFLSRFKNDFSNGAVFLKEYFRFLNPI